MSLPASSGNQSVGGESSSEGQLTTTSITNYSMIRDRSDKRMMVVLADEEDDVLAAGPSSSQQQQQKQAFHKTSQQHSLLQIARDSMEASYVLLSSPPEQCLQPEDAALPVRLQTWAQHINQPYHPTHHSHNSNNGGCLPTKILHPPPLSTTSFQKGFISAQQDNLQKWKCGDCQLAFVASKAALVVQCPKCQAIL